MKMHQLMTALIERSDKTQAEIAREVGYARPNFLSMIKTGDSKVPLEKVPAFARALDVDETFLMRLALREYAPEIHRVIVTALGPPLTRNERALIAVYRQAAPLDDLEMDRAAREAVRRTLEKRRPGRDRAGSRTGLPRRP